MANSKFNLSKGEEKKGFKISKNDGTASEREQTPENTTTSNGGNKSKTWLWLLIVLIVIAIILFLWKPWTTTPIEQKVTPIDSTKQTPKTKVADENTTVSTKETVSGGETSTESTSEQANNTETNPANQGSTPPASKPVPQPSPTPAVSGEIEQLAKEVIQGRYGNGTNRKQQLGDRYSEIQQRVNEKYREKGNY